MEATVVLYFEIQNNDEFVTSLEIPKQGIKKFQVWSNPMSPNYVVVTMFMFNWQATVFQAILFGFGLSIFETILFLNLFLTTEFPVEFENNLVEPKYVEAIEKHAKRKSDILKVPWETSLTLWIVSMLPCGDKDPPPQVRAKNYSKSEKGRDKE